MAALGTEIVPNNGFETATEGVLANWYVSNAAVVQDTTIYREAGTGVASVKIPASRYMSKDQLGAAASLYPGRDLTLSFYMYDDAGLPAAWASGGGGEAGGDYSKDTPDVVSEDGKEYKCITTVGSGTYSPTSTGGSTYWTQVGILVTVAGELDNPYTIFGSSTYIFGCAEADTWEQKTWTRKMPSNIKYMKVTYTNTHPTKDLWVDDSSCTSINTNQMRSWIGHPRAELTPTMGGSLEVDFEVYQTTALNGATSVDVAVTGYASLTATTAIETQGNNSATIDVSSLSAGSYSVTVVHRLTASPFTVYQTDTHTLTILADNRTNLVDKHQRLLIEEKPDTLIGLYTASLALVLKTTMNASVTSVVATSAIPSTFPAAGNIKIGSEIIAYASYTGDTFTCTGGRGSSETTAAAHTAGAAIQNYDILTAIQTAGYNAEVSYTILSPYYTLGNATQIATVKEIIAAKLAFGIRTIFNLKDMYVGGRYVGYYNSGGTNDAAGVNASITNLVNTFKDEEGVIGWYLEDEQSFRNIINGSDVSSANATALAASVATIRSIDPDKPVFGVNFSLQDITTAIPLLDVMGLDVYPGQNLNPRINLVTTKQAKRLQDDVMGRNHLLIALECGSVGTSGVNPSLANMLCDVDSAVCHGIRGFMWFSLGISTEGILKTADAEANWTKVKAVNDHVKAISGIINSIDAPLQATATTGIVLITRMFNGEPWVIAVNPTAASIDATFTVANGYGATKAGEGVPGTAEPEVIDMTVGESTSTWIDTLAAGVVKCFRLYNHLLTRVYTNPINSNVFGI